MIALIGNLDIVELMVIALFAVMIFGNKLPRVAAQAVTQVTRARRALQKVWRESGIGDEIRDVQREIERNAQRLREADPRSAARQLTRDIEVKVREPHTTNRDETTEDPDAARADEPEAEAQRRPDWYPQEVASPYPADAETAGLESEPESKPDSEPPNEPDPDEGKTRPGE